MTILTRCGVVSLNSLPLFQVPASAASPEREGDIREKEIAEFWSARPCGDHLVGGASRGDRCEYEEFFTRYDAFNYRLEAHIPGCLDGLDVAGRRVLEIDLGQGAESEQLIRRGALLKVALGAALAVIYPLARAGLFKPSGIVGAHVRNARRAGLRSYLRMRRFIHHNTDGPDNPHSRVYDVRTARQHFPDFSLVRVHKHFMHAPPLPVHALPGGHVAGWHLWVHMRPKWRTDESAATSTSETTAEWCGPATKDR
ncbi:hypothetical protein OOK58_19045 [Streptomyces sp. NBC_01728]|uniref:hypothetical protein n=1 Tax=unclassified Streptomyces TaxID=2593676 RepID=UPI002256D3FA|nr:MULTISPECIES: hypothetical protein [unclassified Streptomyces]MCX4454164.1 hypothetical protein [Streptomyces sp. NBC_01719]MCX4493524.1 hypothetical protein [Streptomyces sp. NBC_01728]